MTDARSRNRVFLLLILALGVIPMLGAWWLLSGARESGPWATSNHGRLLEPGLNIESVGLAGLASGEGIWRLIIVPEDAGCSVECQEALPILRALHLRLGKDSSRVRRVMLGPRITEEESAGGVRLEHLQVEAQLEAGVYIADPLGNLVLHYQWGQAGAPLLEDFEHLLDLSRIG